MLRSNIAACHLKLEDWKAAIDSATAAIDSLDRISPTKVEKKAKSEVTDDDRAEVVEITGEGEDAERELAKLKITDQKKDNILRIRAKTLMRRAKAKSELGGWGNLQGAEDGTLFPIGRTSEDIWDDAYMACNTHRLQAAFPTPQPPCRR